jgi:hypothetical protein
MAKFSENFQKNSQFRDLSVQIVLFPKEANGTTPENRKASRQKPAHSIQD